MTTNQPGAPAQPQAPAAPSARTGVPPNLADQIDAANRAVEEAGRRATERATAASQAPGGGRPGSISVIKNGTGNVVVTTSDGRVVTIDPRAGLDEDAIQTLVQTALAPPHAPSVRNDGETAVRIVGTVFSFVFLLVLTILAFRLLGRRATAGASVQHLPPDLAPRLARIEQAIEAVAIEVERISESERYSARLLTERLPERAPQGVAGASVTADVAR